MKIIHCSPEHLPEVAGIFYRAFYDSVAFFVKPDKRVKEAIYDIIRLFYFSFRKGFFVAVDEEGEVTGYLVAIRNAAKLWISALISGYLFRAFYKWITGSYGISPAALGRIIFNKIYYIIFAVEARSGGQILNIAVDPDSQGKGIGSDLMAKGMDYLKEKGVKSVMLEVRPGNTPAKKLYQNYGFEMIGKARDLQGEWLVMKASLKEDKI